MNRQPLVQDTVRQLGREQYTIRSEEVTWFGQLFMDMHEMARGNTVTICEHHVIGIRRCDSTIADGGGSKSLVLVPNMCQRERRAPGKLPHNLSRLSLRPVICNHKPEILIALATVTFQYNR